MARSKKALPLLEGVEISAVAAEGKAVARIAWPADSAQGEGDPSSVVLFVPFVVPGDIVDVQVTRRKHSYWEGRAVRMVQPSPLRSDPFCPHFGVCGGCKWQCLTYAEQLKAKQQQVVDQLVRIGKVDIHEVLSILPSPQLQAYRNKLEFAFSNRCWLTDEQVRSGVQLPHRNALGFHIAGAFDKVLDIRQCILMDDLNNRLRNDIRDFALTHGLSFYDLRDNRGLLRSLMMRNSHTGEFMLLVQLRMDSADERAQAMALLQHIADTFPQVTSLLYVDNHKANDTFADLPVHVFKGTPFIYEIMGDLRFKVGPKSFYQTNTEQAHELYKTVLRFAHLTGDEQVYDLYTGTGTIACFLSRHCRGVVGIEYVPEAIEDARVNAQLNGITNCRWFAGDMKDVLTAEFIAREGHPDVLITDPPRAGMHSAVVETIRQAAPQRIVYVSCNPATQARDLALLAPDYEVLCIQPVDMFPHTQHVENVALLQRR